ncbi:hypothetical protein DAEQUDRAFT_725830 [Daedalea quercina L-15889]|uniref:DUF6533 domain-containing protein n=1 Tax=Daedalea quercina L-15889 TaxID=1314783 RepID=A0A165R235_9APHY|nr:hypothetical protein DAEQUDRAFT_725830 [Daedalea quercina L-15889]
MSSVTEEAIAGLEASFISNCILSVSCSFYVYERFLILGQEVEFVWRRKLSLVTVVYILMHISMCTSLGSAVALLVVTGCKSGFILAIVDISSSILFRWTIGVISALRVYAINGRAMGIPLTIIILFLMFTSYDFYNACSMFVLQVPPPVGCLILTSTRTDVQRGLKDASLVCAVIAEVLVLVPTWQATYGARKAARDSMRVPVSAMLLRDGTMYFGIIVSLFIINAVLELTVTEISLTGLTFALQAVCVSRLYLNLRHAARIPDIAHTGSSCTHEVSYFSRVVGSLDGTLVFASDGTADEDADSSFDSTLNVVESFEMRLVDVPVGMVNDTNSKTSP